MSSVYSRTFRSSPHRNASATWDAIVELLTQGSNSSAKKTLNLVAGIASSLIAEKGPKTSPIVATGDGPRTRIYCTYDDDAVDGSGMNEDSLGYVPLEGDWRVSLPCPNEDLSWVSTALKKLTTRVVAHDIADGFTVEKTENHSSNSNEFDMEAFLKS